MAMPRAFSGDTNSADTISHSLPLPRLLGLPHGSMRYAACMHGLKAFSPPWECSAHACAQDEDLNILIHSLSEIARFDSNVSKIEKCILEKS
jgi:hypothetical protein